MKNKQSGEGASPLPSEKKGKEDYKMKNASVYHEMAKQYQADYEKKAKQQAMDFIENSIMPKIEEKASKGWYSVKTSIFPDEISFEMRDYVVDILESYGYTVKKIDEYIAIIGW